MAATRSPDSLKLGVITPTTFHRKRFLRRFCQQVLTQQHRNWEFLLVHDGPDTLVKPLYDCANNGDPRMLYFATETRANDYGRTPRQFASQWFADRPAPPDYLLYWDDDNYFHPAALSDVAQELVRQNLPDMLIVPLKTANYVMPLTHLPLRGMLAGQMDTGNLVIKTGLAVDAFTRDESYMDRNSPDPARFGDHRLYRVICEKPDVRVERSAIAPIGRYDGLRRLVTLRWQLGIPPLGLYGRKWYEPIHRLLKM